ncbi:MAG: glycosyltransferase family 39 protein [Chloroflexota bacterium]|nr:glycosyltransferase family 39 protein [Chloroflexota bacterium]MCY3583924.1 glycosyltransferase family 39 protein [Chloroflexota bacterium]MDE2649496.1 glycosyltransferase family 39 protein [Chloroflexota bacterium]MXV94085.1 DUF2142 domain-containing protein [Chloroflexota bacterium]MXX49616.1 DUF2142 domain-containing protein [Chloroflexota bacterium]
MRLDIGKENGGRSMAHTQLERAAFIAILVGYLVVGALYALSTPAWQAPDEPAHYNYIRQVAEAGCCPRIEPGDWDSAALAQLTSSRFAPQRLRLLPSVQYEDHQPPLYYLLASPLFQLSEGALAPLRLFSVLLGAGVVALSFVISRQLLLSQPHVALAVMALVAFLPQHVAMLASVNNDALAELLVGLCLLWMLRYLNADTSLNPPDESGGSRKHAAKRYAHRLFHSPWGAGLLVGAAFLTKLTIYFLALLVPLAIWLRWRGEKRGLPELARALASFALVAGAIGGLWWLRNAHTYGFPDILALGAHDVVVADQPRTADYIAERGMGAYLDGLAGTIFRSSFGQFGWMALPLDGVLGGWLYRLYGLLLLLGAAGAWHGLKRIAKPARIILISAVGLVLLQTVYYNLEFVQWQGRYLFPALIPLACIVVCGVDRWLRWGWARWLLTVGLMCLAAVDVYLLFRVIVPGLSP